MASILDVNHQGAKKLVFFFMAMVLTVSCTKKEEGPSVEETLVAAKITDYEKQMGTFDEKMKDAENDPGLKLKLAEEKELLKSRLLRLKKKMKAFHPEAEGGGGHGGGGEATAAKGGGH